MPEILCGGLIAVDLIFEIGDFPAKGTKNSALSSRMLIGGGALNSASTIVGLGGQAVLAGVIGDDIHGNFLRDEILRCGINDRLVYTKIGSVTSRSANLISPDGERTIINHRDDDLAKAEIEIPTEFLFDAALVDTRLPKAALQIVEAARRRGKSVVVDAEAPVADAIPVLKKASHVVFSQQGLADFAGEGGDALERAMHQLGGWCAVTRGSLPVLCHDGQNLFEVPVLPVAAVNTLGAGDVWHAAFTLSLANGQSEIEAVHWANAAVSFTVTRPLYCEVLPTAADVSQILKDKKEKMRHIK